MQSNTNLNNEIINVRVHRASALNKEDYLIFDTVHMEKAMKTLSYNGLKIYLYILSSVQNDSDNLILDEQDIYNKMKLSTHEIENGINNLLKHGYLKQCGNNYSFNEAGQ